MLVHQLTLSICDNMTTKRDFFKGEESLQCMPAFLLVRAIFLKLSATFKAENIIYYGKKCDIIFDRW